MGIMSIAEKIAKRIEEKPIPSMVAFQLLKVIEDEDHSLKDVVQLVENDASLTSEVLKMANSAAYYRGEPVTTVNRAVLLMGEMMVVGVAICASTSIVFHSPLEGYESAAGEMWDYSLRSAIASRELARFAKKPVQPGLAFTAGLLHDIGKSVISDFLVGSTQDLIDGTGNGHDYLEGERKLTGTDHAEVGYALGKHWGLPESLCVAIRDHHAPLKSDDEFRTLVYVVHLGEIFSMIGGNGTGADTLAYKVDPDYENYVSFSKKDFEGLLLKIEEDFESIKNAIQDKG
jgi:putative nucleotidyltransferase with HDIG domain